MSQEDKLKLGEESCYIRTGPRTDPIIGEELVQYAEQRKKEK